MRAEFYGQIIALIICLSITCSVSLFASPKSDGYRGIWFALGQLKGEYGDKYSGGLATYTAKHIPIAVHAPEVNKTFFVYGGTLKGERHLLITASYYDHSRHLVPRPTIVCDKQGVSDPHDNASICIDDKGYIWIFVSGRARKRPGFKYRSKEPYSIDDFELVSTQEFTYPQPWFIPGKGFLHCFTMYSQGRELYWETSADGKTWSGARKLAGFGGHYQISREYRGRVATAFNYHPGGNVDRRTNIYFLQTDDFGKTWKTVDGRPVKTPLDAFKNEALVRDYEKEGLLCYNKDLNFDQDGNPVILHVISRSFMPGPKAGPRIWRIAHWIGSSWEFHDITSSDHNYDTGSLYIEKDGTWKVIGPTEPGPQVYGTGGEIAIWVSHDGGRNWSKLRDVTRGSRFNHGYVRRPVNAHPDFYALWADGNPFEFSESHLYFCNRDGDKVWALPYDMKVELEAPIPVKPAR